MMAASLVSLALALLPSTEAPGGNQGGDTFFGNETAAGSSVNLVGSNELRDWSEQALVQADTGPWFEYDSVSVCGGHPERAESDSMCLRASAMDDTRP